MIRGMRSTRWPIQLGPKHQIIEMRGQSNQLYHLCKHFFNPKERWWQISEVSREEFREWRRILKSAGFPLGDECHDHDFFVRYLRRQRLWSVVPQALALAREIYQTHYMRVYRLSLRECLDAGGDTFPLHPREASTPEEQPSWELVDGQRRLFIVTRARERRPERLIVRTCYRLNRKTSVRLSAMISSLGREG